MALNYAKLQTIATRVVRSVKQGTVVLVRKTDTLIDLNAPWGSETHATVSYTLDAVVSPVDEEYIDNESILVTDKKVVFAVPPVTPDATIDKITVDGVSFQIVGIKRIPEAGTAVAYIAFIRI